MPPKEFARTPVALECAGVNDPSRLADWRSAVARAGLYAPPTVPGQARVFTVDDILVTQIFQGFRDIGATPKWAAKIATMVRLAIDEFPDAPYLTVWKVRQSDGTPDMAVSPSTQPPTPDADAVFPIDLEKYRASIRRMLRRKFDQEGA